MVKENPSLKEKIGANCGICKIPSNNKEEKYDTCGSNVSGSNINNTR